MAINQSTRYITPLHSTLCDDEDACDGDAMAAQNTGPISLKNVIFQEIQHTQNTAKYI